MNLLSQQINEKYEIIEDKDQPLSKSQIKIHLSKIFGDSFVIKKINDKKFIVFRTIKNKEIVILPVSITYLGGNGQHPIYKKRIQLPKWFKESTKDLIHLGYDVKYLGIYHYNNHLIFVDFNVNSYISKKMNNSSAHVYINDLYQTKEYKVFNKIDQNNNFITVINRNNLTDYLNGFTKENTLFEVFEKFNKIISSDWILASNEIKEQYENKWGHWKQTEWQGWYLEFKFFEFLTFNKLNDKIIYTGSSNKSKELLDFDLFFNEQNFFGDLKTSDKSKKESLGNDQLNFIRAVEKHGKFWYIIYEHETRKDSSNNFEATLFRSKYISELENKQLDEKKMLSYSKKMKHSIKFTNMVILELNPSNYKSVLVNFNQGKQPTGEKRKPKFLINKRNIDNIVVYRYTFK
jgi:hypothetical protein